MFPGIEEMLSSCLSKTEASMLSSVSRVFNFFPDRAAAVLEMRRVLAEGGRIAISTWRPLDENPLFYGLNSAAAEPFSLHNGNPLAASANIS